MCILIRVVWIPRVMPRYLLSDGWHQVPVAVAHSCHRSLLFLLIQHFELVLGERLARLWNHLNHIQDHNLNTESNNKPSADVSVSYCHHFVQIGRSQCCGVIVVCCSPGPCRWPPPPASGRSLLRCSPSVRTPSPDSSEPPSSYRSHVPTRPGRTLCRQREDSLFSLSSSHMVNLTDIWLIDMRHLLSQLYNIVFNSSVVPQIWCCVMANWIVCKSVN